MKDKNSWAFIHIYISVLQYTSKKLLTLEIIWNKVSICKYIYIWIRMWLPFCPLVSMNIKSWTQLWLELTLEKSQFNGTEFIRTKNSSMWMCQLHVSSRPLDSMLIKSSTFWLELVLLLDKIFIGQNLFWIKVGLC